MEHVQLTVYDGITEFFEKHSDKNLIFLSSHGTKSYWDIEFVEDMYFVFGSESVGLPSEIIENNKDKLYKIPIKSSHIRSLNLANAVSVVIYEALRNIGS